jgi:hypothetical protein
LPQTLVTVLAAIDVAFLGSVLFLREAPARGAGSCRRPALTEGNGSTRGTLPPGTLSLAERLAWLLPIDPGRPWPVCRKMCIMSTVPGVEIALDQVTIWSRQ